MIDLRSDTVTKPTADMRAAMAAAEVGDDDYRDDRTVIRLEERAAALLDKEAGLYLPSGVMSNLVAALSHCADDRRVVALANSHVAWSLTGQPRLARLLQLTTVPSDARGLPQPDALLAALDAPGTAPVGLLCYENSHNLIGGTALTPAETAATIAAARERGIPVHLDGARLFNAAVALGVPPRDLVPAGSGATFCLSKSLACPVGSVVVGDAAFIARARRARKMVGGGMRQAGIIAAAGLVALRDGPEGMIERLADDHANARFLADALASMPGITRIDPGRVRTNFVIFAVGEDTAWPDDRHGRERVLRTRAAFLRGLQERGAQMIEYPGGRIRAIPHYGIERSDIEVVIAAVRATLAELGLVRPVPV